MKISVLIGWVGLVVGLMVFQVNAVVAGEAGCHWEGSKGTRRLVCTPNWFSTGCIGLRNVSGSNVYFTVNGTMPRRTMANGQHKKFDYTSTVTISSCLMYGGQPNSQPKGFDCWDAFDRTTDRPKGGGCGCKGFRCLPTFGN